MAWRFSGKIRFEKLKSVTKDTLQQMNDGELQLVAASLAFSTAIALVPFLAVVLATFQSIGGLEVLYPKVEALLLRNMREAAGSDVTKFMRIFLQNINAGRMGGTGAVFLFITSLRLLHDMEVGIHRVWNQRNTRPFYKRLIYQWALILAIPVFLAIYVGIMTLDQFQFVVLLLPAGFANSTVLIGSLFLIYKFVPDVKVHSKAAFISALVAYVALYGVHKTYAAMALRFFNYSKIYGSFAALPLLLLWILTLWYVILGGVALCASLQKRHVA
ncbi:YihY/virulence factor BrkB family protein [Bdellovibrio reynosensis]|uniref:YihY/virulence factor BrkB family protein n=1 Tax=Bdellovibrio reynosensis TaxID=2835041 RepID=A0ABY4C9X0_9BACT|nr:YihY/virulence factor BrkB family protein [Bdellovibrio reynosensis]UOF01274.1 YihY/virulence factor BrkB family protein [Bdellovibrio reynosensis]